MSSINIIHHRLLRTAILQALGESDELKASMRELRRIGMPPIEWEIINRCWLVIRDYANYYNPFGHQLRSVCQRALLGIVDLDSKGKIGTAYPDYQGPKYEGPK